MTLGLGFLGCFGQLTGFTLGIYVFYDWNEMESLTWLFCKYIALVLSFVCFLEAFYLMVGSWYYLFTKGDWVYTSVYQHMLNRAKETNMKASGFDEDRLACMEEYVERLEE